MRQRDPQAVVKAAKESMAVQVRAMLGFHKLGIPTFDYGNNIRQMAQETGVDNAFDFPGFVPAYIRPLFCRGVGPFRWAALSGDPEDIHRTDAKVKELIPDNPHLHNWLDMAAGASVQGLPARACWVGLGERVSSASPSTKWWPRRTEGADRDRPRSSDGSVASLTADRRHEGRLRRRVRLAAAQRAANCASGTTGSACITAAASAWASRTFRHGDLLRRHARGSAAHRARADQRPWYRSHAPCRCRLRHRDRLRTRTGAEATDDQRLMSWDLLLTDCSAATMAEGYGAIEDAAIAIEGERIAWIGSQADLPKQSAKETVSLDGRWVTPGLIDCHTHLVFGGERAGESSSASRRDLRRSPRRAAASSPP
jgi:hypothetical protein